MKELRKELLLQLDERLRPLGFRKREQSFRRDLGPCRQAFHISFINHVGDFDVTADVGVRHHSVEDMLNEGQPHLKDSEKKETYTVGAELGNIIGTGQHRWTVVDTSDIPSVVDGIMNYFDSVGIPFLERFSSLKEVYRVLREDGAEARLICPIPTLRSRLKEVIGSLASHGAS